ncbi:MAG: glycosyltransferase family 4 protein [Solirubrobacteraceae bacterium]|jgi:UDP-GlcNAc:undecaprenyl-phosphate GlcNAc-1-phosphate transferase
MHQWHAAFGFLVAAGVATLLTPVVARLARALGMVDRPRVGGLTQRNTPLLGGVAILVGIVVATALFMPHIVTLPRSARTLGERATVNTWGLMVGAALIMLVGAMDDWLDLRWWQKLFGQVAAAVVAVKAGAIVTDVTIPFLGAHQFPHAGGALTVVWLVALMNVVNFTDGVDGLAAGLCTIDGVAFSIIAFNLGVTGAAILAAITAGAALGFLVHNFHPASIFMGDAGSNLLGYMLGVTSVVGTLKTNAVVALIVPLVILAIPLLDTGFVVAKRLKYKRAPWTRDANHFHHRFARIGFSQRKTVAYLYAWSTVLAGLAVAMRLLPYHPHNTHYDWLWVGVLIGIGVVALAASVYLVVVLEILKLGRLRLIDLRRADPAAPEEEIRARAAHDVETGEFTRVR